MAACRLVSTYHCENTKSLDGFNLHVKSATFQNGMTRSLAAVVRDELQVWTGSCKGSKYIAADGGQEVILRVVF
jgi:hypothetical protein